jgi:hypothetical protein
MEDKFMKKLYALLFFIFIGFMGCDDTSTPKEVPVQNISIDIDDILFIGQQTTIKTEFFPSDTTERNLSYFSSNENVLSINNSGIITPKGKGIATITVKCQNETEVNKTVSVYQTISKPNIINNSEEWGPFEKINGTGSSYHSVQEIGINNNVEIIINPNTIVEDIKFVISQHGKLSTINCETYSTRFSNVSITSNGRFEINNITIIDLQLDNNNGSIMNCDFLPQSINATYGTFHAMLSSDYTLKISRNIFRGRCHIYSYGNISMENNHFISSIHFYGWYTGITFQYNSIDMQYASLGSSSPIANIGYPTPNIDLSNNYWGTSDTSLIDNFIIDRNDSLSISYYVNYLPILTEKHELTPCLN